MFDVLTFSYQCNEAKSSRTFSGRNPTKFRCIDQCDAALGHLYPHKKALLAKTNQRHITSN